MRRNSRTNRDDAKFEMVLLRRFHLTPGQPEYVFIKRRVSVNDADQLSSRGGVMPRGDKSKYTEKQKRKAEHIERGYEQQGVPEPEAEKRAWATVNKMDGGGKRSGSGRGKPVKQARHGRAGRGAHSLSRTFSQSKFRVGRKAAKTRSTLNSQTPRPFGDWLNCRPPYLRPSHKSVWPTTGS
jgi:plasmid stabilization system protein ParE